MSKCTHFPRRAIINNDIIMLFFQYLFFCHGSNEAQTQIIIFGYFVNCGISQFPKTQVPAQICRAPLNVPANKDGGWKTPMLLFFLGSILMLKTCVAQIEQ